jgi:hypothetical protein
MVPPIPEVPPTIKKFAMSLMIDVEKNRLMVPMFGE